MFNTIEYLVIHWEKSLIFHWKSLKSRKNLSYRHIYIWVSGEKVMWFSIVREQVFEGGEEVVKGVLHAGGLTIIGEGGGWFFRGIESVVHTMKNNNNNNNKKDSKRIKILFEHDPQRLELTLTRKICLDFFIWSL